MSEPPIPLKRADDELARALGALRDEHDDRARIARVAERMSAQLDAPMPEAAGHALTRLLRRTSAKLIAGLLVGAGVATWWSLRPEAPRDVAAPVAHGETRGDAPLHHAPSPPTVEHLAPVVPAPAPGVEEPAPTSATRARPARASALRHDPSPREPAEPVPQGPARDAPAREPALGGQPAAPSSSARTPSVVAERPAAKSEVDLIFEAHAVLAHSPRAALRLLDEHSARFPGGMLAPEREVMAIEALRALGQREAAEQRFARFTADYPDSLHRARLEKSARDAAAD